MPKIQAHSLAGVAAGVLAVPAVSRMLDSELTPGEKVGVIGATITGSCLPDILEPAISPGHRRLFHSVAAGVGLLGAVLLIIKQYSERQASYRATREDEGAMWSDLQPEPVVNPLMKAIRYILIASIIGYLLHLVMDSTTPRSLPLLGL